MSQSIRFLFDFISPYAYIAWTQVHDLAARHAATVEPVPILFAALLDAHGHKGPAEIPPKRVYMYKHVFRLAHRLGIPLTPPPGHPFNPLLALRVASLPMSGQVRRELIDRLFAAAWGGGSGVEDPAVVARVASEAGLDGAAAVEEAGTAESKARLRGQTVAAVEEGVFGVPSLFVGDELFWGYDSFPDVEQRLRGEDPVTSAELLQWVGLPATARRIPR